MDAVDVIVGSPRALPKPLEAMLFQSTAPGVQAPPDAHGEALRGTLFHTTSVVSG